MFAFVRAWEDPPPTKADESGSYWKLPDDIISVNRLPHCSGCLKFQRLLGDNSDLAVWPAMGTSEPECSFLVWLCCHFCFVFVHKMHVGLESSFFGQNSTGQSFRFCIPTTVTLFSLLRLVEPSSITYTWFFESISMVKSKKCCLASENKNTPWGPKAVHRISQSSRCQPFSPDLLPNFTASFLAW